MRSEDRLTQQVQMRTRCPRATESRVQKQNNEVPLVLLKDQAFCISRYNSGRQGALIVL